MKKQCMVLRTSAALLAVGWVAGLNACGSGQTRTANLACGRSGSWPDSQRDFYEEVATGADNCGDLVWLKDNCSGAPGGIWGRGGVGKLGEPVTSCRAAVENRNRVLRCW